MYVRPEGKKKSPIDISVPRNYSGNAFSEIGNVEAYIEKTSEECIQSENRIPKEAPSSTIKEARNLFPGITNGDDLIILGLLILFFQDGFDDDILPLILIMLFLKK